MCLNLYIPVRMMISVPGGRKQVDVPGPVGMEILNRAAQGAHNHVPLFTSNVTELNGNCCSFYQLARIKSKAAHWHPKERLSPVCLVYCHNLWLCPDKMTSSTGMYCLGHH